MKKLVLALVAFCGFLFAADALHLYHNFDQGQAEAKKVNKPIMLMIHTAGCPECAYMEEVVFNDPDTKAYMEKNFVNIALDFKKDEIPKKYVRFGVPTFYFTDPDGNVLLQHIGGTRGNKFLELLKQAKAKAGS